MYSVQNIIAFKLPIKYIKQAVNSPTTNKNAVILRDYCWEHIKYV